MVNYWKQLECWTRENVKFVYVAFDIQSEGQKTKGLVHKAALKPLEVVAFIVPLLLSASA